MNQANNKDVPVIGGNNWAVSRGYDLIRLQTYNEIRNVIYMFDRVIKPILSERIQDLDSYAEKLFNYAFVYAAVDKEILGFIAFYANDTKTNTAYLAQIAVQPVAQNRRVGRMLLDKCIEVSKSRRMTSLKLEVYKVNSAAIRFYERNGFKFCGEASEDSMYMAKKIIDIEEGSRGVNMNKPIQVTRSSMPKFEEYIEEIRDLWDSHWLTNMGVKHKQLEAELSQYLNTPNITLFTNGHLALESAIEAFNLTGEVITTPFTFASTTHAIVRNGLEPVFCDINPDDYTMDTGKLESLITNKTSAIIPVHVYGNICNVSEIERIAKKYGLKVIYDAAHTFGVTVDGVGVANFGDASMFSFHATKVFNTIEGGAVTFKNEKLNKTLNNLKNFGITGLESVEYVGGNAKMNEFQAAMGICNLRHVDAEIEKRKAVVERYREKLNGIDGIKLIQPQDGVKSNYAYFPVLFDGYRLNRDEVYEVLKNEDIIARKYFYPLTNSFECYRNRFNYEETPVAKHIAERILTLPLYANLALEDVDRICDIILG